MFDLEKFLSYVREAQLRGADNLPYIRICSISSPSADYVVCVSEILNVHAVGIVAFLIEIGARMQLRGCCRVALWIRPESLTPTLLRQN